ncbi:MAG: hypothetical protein NC078_12215 [Ruminococcus sp.]|nr:hypothetical protein [Ruminococcus sp.]
MYWIDGNTGKELLSVTDSVDERAIKYTDKINEVIIGNNYIVTLHTHPSSMPPSIDDFNSCFEHGYAFGVIACHNGKVYKYSSSQKINKMLYDLNVSDFIEMGYDEFTAQLKTLEKLKESYLIEFEEV